MHVFRNISAAYLAGRMQPFEYISAICQQLLYRSEDDSFIKEFARRLVEPESGDGE